MRHYGRFCILTVAALAVGLGSVGCKTSSGKSVRTYEYSNEPTPDRQETEELDSEYKMVSPGEMADPGEMTDD